MIFHIMTPTTSCPHPTSNKFYKSKLITIGSTMSQSLISLPSPWYSLLGLTAWSRSGISRGNREGLCAKDWRRTKGGSMRRIRIGAARRWPSTTEWFPQSAPLLRTTCSGRGRKLYLSRRTLSLRRSTMTRFTRTWRRCRGICRRGQRRPRIDSIDYHSCSYILKGRPIHHYFLHFIP